MGRIVLSELAPVVHRRTLYRCATGALALCALFASLLHAAEPTTTATPENRLAALRQRVNHIIVIYQENWSFDGLYGKFPGADGIDQAGAAARQVDKAGTPYKTLPRPLMERITDPRFPADLPVGPFDLAKYVAPDGHTGDLIHRFYHEQLQINGGKMDKYVAWTNAGGLTMSYYDAGDMPEGKLARQFTLCDHFFHAAFGGSFLNHIWLVAAASPTFPNAPKAMIGDPDPTHLKDAEVTPDGYAVNTVLSVNLPHPHDAAGHDTTAKHPERLLPNQTMPTIGDRLTGKGLSWAWYAGGWDKAMAGDARASTLFEYHHQPFVYFASFADGTAAKKEHLKDEQEFLTAVADSALPAVSFIKPIGENDEHPGYASVARGQQHAADLVAAIQKSKYWADSVVIITYDENGGRWDHVAPPKKDRWGPGTRVPTIVISPFSQGGHVDHTEYDTTSILRLIEERWELAPLSDRDRDAGDLLNALRFE